MNCILFSAFVDGYIVCCGILYVHFHGDIIFVNADSCCWQFE